MLKYPAEDQQAIQQAIHSGQDLAICLCAGWCHNCEAWREQFGQLPLQHSTTCFIWLDIDEHPDMVTEVELDTLPVLLLYKADQIAFVGPIRPDMITAATLIRGARGNSTLYDPGVRDFLSEP